MKRILIIFLLLAGLFSLTAQEAAAHRLGIHFQVYGEPHEPDNPLYVNVLPLVYETTVGRCLTVKAGTILSLRISDGVTLGNLGVMAGLPFFPFGMNDRPVGFFIGPLILGSYNVHTSEFVVSTALDAGYSFYMTETLSMTLGGELGFSTFFLNGEITFRPHYGPGVYLYANLPSRRNG